MFRRKRRFFRQPTKPRARVNEWIRITPIMVIDSDGTNLGVMETRDALERARQKGLDLIEIAPNVRPPVCRIMDFGKYKYQQAQHDKKQKVKQKVVKIKGIRIGLSTSVHDIDTKAKQAAKFLDKGHKVKIEMILKGREKALMNNAHQKLNDFLSSIPTPIKKEQEARRQGRGLTVVVIKDITVNKDEK